MANLATSTILGRATAGTGVPEALSAAQVRTVLGLTAIATSGSAADLTTGTLPAARFDDTAHGARAGGALHSNVVAAGAAGFMTGADKTKLDGVASGANNYVHPSHSGDVTSVADGATTIAAGAVTLAKMANVASGSVFYRKTAATGAPEVQTLATLKTDLGLTGTNSGDQTITLTGDVAGSGTGSFGATIAADAVTNAKLANVATATIKGRVTASTGDPEDLTGTQATALLDTFTNTLKGLAPASGGGTANFLRADGTWAAPAGGGGGSGDVVGPASATDNALVRFDATTGKLVQNSAVLVLDGGEMTLPLVASPATPGTDSLNLFGRKVGGRMLPAIKGPSGLDTSLQPHFGRNAVTIARPNGNGTVISLIGMAVSAVGTATTAPNATTNRHTEMKRIEYLVTAAATTAVAGVRSAAGQFSVGGVGAGRGGFHSVFRWGPATGTATATNRAFAGFRPNATPTDVEPSAGTNSIGMGWDAADANIQFMHNDATGTATKIDLGASFPVPTTDRAEVYEIAMFSPPGTTQLVSYEITNLSTGAVASGTVSTDLPAATVLLAPGIHMSVGGTSSVIGLALMSLYIETDY
jgi:hypothetical protein